ncbi:MAG: putative PurR-regulated permease PerM [Halieaceae bacterium]|jgi:predicted PurR-regulated permease PerM
MENETKKNSENPSAKTSFEPQFVRNMLESFLRIGLVFVLLVASYDIIRPFIVPIVWGAIIACAAMPLVNFLEAKLGGKRGLSSTLITLGFILLLVVPTWMVTDSMLGALKDVAQAAKAHELVIPAPPAKIASIPMIGDDLYAGWTRANNDIEAVLRDAAPQIQSITTGLLKKLGSSLVGVLMFVVSLAIAGGFMAYADSCGRLAHRFFIRVGGLNPGGEWATLVVATVRSVLKGVVGVAVIQTVLISIGLFAVGFPGAALWSALILFLAIAQLPALIVVLPMIAYAFSAYDTTTAVIFAIWSLIAGASDNILKPILMGRGVDIPMPVILIGAIGGMVASGIIGLFAGAVLLSIWYKLFILWLEQEAA